MSKIRGLNRSFNLLVVPHLFSTELGKPIPLKFEPSSVHQVLSFSSAFSPLTQTTIFTLAYILRACTQNMIEVFLYDPQFRYFPSVR